jgi:hypothetical protein
MLESDLRKLVARLLMLVVLVSCLALVSASDLTRVVHASPCTDCWDGCAAEDSLCDDYCAGCPYEDEHTFFTTSGHTVNCAGGVAECMNNCHYAEMICDDNCMYSSCGVPKDR